MFNLSRFTDKVDPNQGTIDIVISDHNLFFNTTEPLVIDRFVVKDTEFALHRTKDMMLVFSHTNQKHGKRISQLNLQDVGNAQKHKLTLTWSDDEVRLYMGALGTKSGKLIIGDFKKITVP